MAIDDIRLDDRALGSDRTIQALVAATLLVAAIGVGWLVLAAATDDHVRHFPAVRVDNRTHLPLQLSVFDVADMGPTWTFVASYGGREVFRQSVPRADVEARGWSLVIPAGATTDLERQGFR